MNIKEQVESALAGNPQWNTGWPNFKNLDWKQAESDFKLAKIIILREIVKDLEIMQFQEREETGNNQAFALVMSIVCREIAVKDWQAKCGTFPVWNGIFSRAKNMVQKNLTGKTVLNSLGKGILKNAKETTFGTCNQSRIQGSSAGSRG